VNSRHRSETLAIDMEATIVLFMREIRLIVKNLALLGTVVLLPVLSLGIVLALGSNNAKVAADMAILLIVPVSALVMPLISQMFRPSTFREAVTALHGDNVFTVAQSTAVLFTLLMQVAIYDGVAKLCVSGWRPNILMQGIFAVASTIVVQTVYKFFRRVTCNHS